MSIHHESATIFQPISYVEHPTSLFGRELPVTFRNQVLSVVSTTFNVGLTELCAPTRCRKNVALARQVAMYLTHIAGGFNLSEVGRLFNRDRTTASHACRVIEDLRDDPNVDKVLLCLEDVLNDICFRDSSFDH